MMRAWVMGAALCGLALLSSCGGDSDEVDFCGETQEQDTPRDSYPAGPFGTTECARIENLALTQPDNSTVDLQSIRSQASSELLLVVTSAGWCTACIEEQPQLQAIHEQFSGKGLVVMVSLFEDSNYAPVDGSYAEQWKRQYELDFMVVADPDKQLHQYYDPSLTPMQMLVDASTMKILQIFVGEDLDTIRDLVEAKLQ